MSITIDGDNVNYNLTNLDDTDSTYQGEGEELFTVDTSNGTLTVELRDNDTVAGFHKRFFDVGGNIETNAVTFQTQSSQTIDGSSTITWDHNNGSFVDLWSDGSNWFSSLQQSADALTTDKATIKELAAVMELTSGQTISNTTTTTVAFDNVLFEDTAIVDGDPSTGKVTVQADGGYVISGQAFWGGSSNWTAGDKAQATIEAPSGTPEIRNGTKKQDTNSEERGLIPKMVNLSANDVVKMTVRQDSGGSRTLNGFDEHTYMTVYRLRA